MSITRINYERLKNFTSEVFQKLNVPKRDADITSDVLTRADLRGIESHGVSRLPRYVFRLKNDLIKPKPKMKVIKETSNTLLIDGDNGLGQVIGNDVMELCIKKAKKSNICFGTVRNSNHFGIAGFYSIKALQHDLIGISLTNSQPLVAPTFGRTRMIGTNPISIAVPSTTELPYVLDMATSIVPLGTIDVYARNEENIPPTWALNNKGIPTKYPEKVLEGGALMPLGGTEENSGYKGYGLGLAVDIFSGILSGGAYGTNVGSPYEKTISNVCHFFGAVNVEAFRPLEEFRKDMDDLVNSMKIAPKAEGQDRIFVHGEIEWEFEEDRKKNGIPFNEKVIKILQGVADDFNLEL
jgi:LDH2 family malate/lactate/ureidoglycolate dehydrogenase